MRSRSIARKNLKAQLRVAPRKAADRVADKTLADRNRRGDRQLSNVWIGQKANILETLPELIEYRDSAPEQCAAVWCRLDAIRAAVKKTNTKCMFEIGN